MRDIYEYELNLHVVSPGIVQHTEKTLHIIGVVRECYERNTFVLFHCFTLFAEARTILPSCIHISASCTTPSLFISQLVVEDPPKSMEL